MWWDLQMDVDGQVMLSCAPYWAHPSTAHEKRINPQENGLPWRDHWMQALYYLPSEVSLKEGEVATLRANHDEYSLWFDLQKGSQPDSVSSKKTEHPVCRCGLHASFGRARIGALNDESRRLKYASALVSCLKGICDNGIGDGGEVTVLCLSEGSLLGIFMAKMAEKICSGKKFKVFCVDGNLRSKKVLDAYVQKNHLSESVTVLEDVSNSDHLGGSKVNVLLGEPHFYSALLPWHNMHIWYRKNELRPLLHSDTLLMPKGASIWAMAVVFTDLWKIRAPVHSAEGFKMESFDKLIEASRSIGDEQVEPQPLWEYPCRALSNPIKLFDFDFQQPIPSDPLVERGIFGTESEFSECNGIALWVDWDLDGKPEHVISTGPVGVSPTPGKFVSWDIHTRQGVRLIEKTSLPINFEARFLPANCDLSLCIQERSEQ